MEFSKRNKWLGERYYQETEEKEEGKENEFLAHFEYLDNLDISISPDISKLEKFLFDIYSLGSLSETHITACLAFIFGNRRIEAGQKVISDIVFETQICAKMIDIGDIIWVCRDCGIRGSCYCSECFDIDKHLNHNYEFQTNQNGECDCGDPVALNPTSFCDRHKETKNNKQNTQLLPKYIQTTGPLIINHLGKCIFEASFELDHLLERKAKKRISMGLRTLAFIFETNKIFIDWIVDSILQQNNAQLTTHKCVPKIGEKVFTEGEIHKCSCTVLDRIMSDIFAYSSQEEINIMFSQIGRQHFQFIEAFHLSYLLNYHTLIRKLPTHKERGKLIDILCQLVRTSKDKIPLIEEPIFFKEYLKIYELLPLFFKDKAEGEFQYPTQIFQTIRYDFNHIINFTENAQALISKTDFLKVYMGILGEIQFSNCLRPRTMHIEYEIEGFRPELIACSKIIYELFKDIILLYDFSDLYILQKIGIELRRGLELSRDYANKNLNKEENYIIIPLNRCLCLFLIKLINSYNMDISKHSLKSNKLRSSLQSIFNFTSEEEMLDLFKWILVTNLHVNNFISEMAAGQWVHYDEQIIRNILQEYREFSSLSLCKNDLVLVQILLYIYPHQDIIYLEYVDILQDLNTNLCLSTENKHIKYLEEKLFTICKLISNDIAYSSIHLVTQIENVYKKINKSDLPYLEHIISKAAVNLLPLGLRKVEFFSLDNILDCIASNFLTPDVKDIAKKYISPKCLNGKNGFTFNNHTLKYCNIFNLFDPVQVLNSEITTKELVKKYNYSNISILSTQTTMPQIQLIQNEIKMHFLNAGLLPIIIDIFISDAEFFSSDGVKLFSLKLIHDFILLIDVPEYYEQAKQIIFITPEKIEKLENKLGKYASGENIIHKESIDALIRTLSSRNKSIPEVKIREESKNEEEIKVEKMAAMRSKVLAELADMRSKFKGEELKYPEESKKDPSLEDPNNNYICCCICLEKLNTLSNNYEDKPYGKVGLISESCFHMKARTYTANQFLYKMKINYLRIRENINNSDYPKYFPTTSDTKRNLITLCGHYLHYECLKEYKNARYIRNIYSCPCCKSISNILLPTLNENSLKISTIQLEEYISSFLFDLSLSENRWPWNRILENNNYLVRKLIEILISDLEYIDILGLDNFYKRDQHLTLSSLFNLLLRYISHRDPGIEDLEEGEMFNLDQLKGWQDAQRLWKFQIPNPTLHVHTLLVMLIPVLLEYVKTQNKRIAVSVSKYYLSNVEQGVKYLIIQAALWFWIKNHDYQFLFLTTQGNISVELLHELIMNEELILDVVFRYLDKFIALISVIEEWSAEKISKETGKIRNKVLPHQELFEVYKSILRLRMDSLNEILSDTLFLENVVNTLMEKGDLNEEINSLIQVNENILPEGKKVAIFKDQIIVAYFHIQNTKLSFEFIEIPHQFDDFILGNYPKECKTCHKRGSKKCICLVCGDIFCINNSKCQSQIHINPISLHSENCAQGIGYFIIIETGTIIVHSNEKAVLINGPYLDEYGNCSSEYFVMSEANSSRDYRKFYLNTQRLEQLKIAFQYGKTIQMMESG